MLSTKNTLRKVLSEDIIEILLTGKIITLASESSLFLKRYYRYNLKDEKLEYTDDFIIWNKSNNTLKTFKSEWSNNEWLVIDK